MYMYVDLLLFYAKCAYWNLSAVMAFVIVAAVKYMEEVIFPTDFHADCFDHLEL